MHRLSQELTIEKLYMTRQVGGPTWSPDARASLHLEHERTQQHLDRCRRWWMAVQLTSATSAVFAAWSPDGNGSLISPITMATSSGYFSGLGKTGKWLT